MDIYDRPKLYGSYINLSEPYVCMYVCKTLFTDASLVSKIVGFHKGRQTIKKRIKEDIYKRTEKERKKKKINSMHIYKKLV